jgi:hypothetical protein
MINTLIGGGPRSSGSETVTVSRKAHYNDDPTLAPVPLSVEEANALLDDPGLVTKRDIPHLLRRVVATAVQVREVRVQYDTELRRRTSAVPRSGIHQTLSPEQAARFLSPEQLEKLFDRFSQERLQALELLRKRAAEDYDRLQTSLDESVEALIHALAQPGLDENTKQQLRAALNRLRRVKDGGQQQ